MKKLIVLVLLAVAGGAGAWHLYSADNRTTSFRTIQAERGDLLATISATGTIEPEEVIDIGAQIAGQIISFGQDPRDSTKLINYSTPVEQGTVLARIDTALYQAQVDSMRAKVQQAEAQLEASKTMVVQAVANLKRAEADLGQMQAKVNQSDRDWKRAQRLGPTRAMADVDVDLAEATFLTAKSGLAVGEATITQNKAALKTAQANVASAEATLADAKAALKNAETNLGYCTIKSPVKGVIVDRRVNIGQTVVSSLNAPSLFLIAKDLTRLQVWASVNEADIANIHSGQSVSFTVDALPDRVFKGVVAPDQPRLNASMTQNVVTYTVVVETDNSDGKLKPYQTANVQFEVSKHSNVVQVGNAALRWKPNPRQVVPEARDEYVRSQQRRTKGPAGEKAPAAEKAPAGADKGTHHRGTLWVEDNGFVRPIKVTTGLSDGLVTEIVGGDIEEGTAVVVGESRPTSGGDTTNPFAPRSFGTAAKKQP
jgi:HlyD family secretion protein